MSTTKQKSLASALFPKSTQAVLRILFSGAGAELHLRGIEHATGQSAGTLQRVLDRFETAGLVIRTKRGNQVFYRANPESAIYEDLRLLVLKTIGLADPIRLALTKAQSRIDVAFIYGSFARGTDTAGSDIDLLVIGDARLQEVVEALAGLQDVLGREVNPITYSPNEYSQRLSSGGHFVSSLRDVPKIFLIGGQDDLDRLG